MTMSRSSSIAIKPRSAKQAAAPVRRSKNVGVAPRRVVEQTSSLELARIVHVDEKGIEVQLPSGGSTPKRAQSLIPYSDLACDDQVVVAHVSGPDAPIVVLGRLFSPLAPPRDVRVNGRKVAIEANTELVLKCADATIRIAHDGLVAVRGDRVVTQARGVNRIRGGSVEIN
jgi:hypothetical protein